MPSPFAAALVYSFYAIQECSGRNEEEISRDGAAIIQQPVVVVWWPTDEYVLEHLLDGLGRTTVPGNAKNSFKYARLQECNSICSDC